MTSVPWSRGKALVWDVTVVDSLSRSRVGSPHLAVEEAAKKKLAKYKEISNSGSIFQPVVFDTQGNYGPETLSFLDELLNKLISTTSETRARSFFCSKTFDPPAPPASSCSACTTQLRLHPRYFKCRLQSGTVFNSRTAIAGAIFGFLLVFTIQRI